jgi:hypothetical protein
MLMVQGFTSRAEVRASRPAESRLLLCEIVSVLIDFHIPPSPK